MAIDATITIMNKITGLSSDLSFRTQFNPTTTPTATTHQRRTQAVADTAEALDLGDISTVELITIKAVSNDLLVDCDYVAAFDEDIIIPEGESATFKPAGIVYIKNEDAAETCQYEYLAIGTT